MQSRFYADYRYHSNQEKCIQGKIQKIQIN